MEFFTELFQKYSSSKAGVRGVNGVMNSLEPLLPMGSSLALEQKEVTNEGVMGVIDITPSTPVQNYKNSLGAAPNPSSHHASKEAITPEHREHLKNSELVKDADYYSHLYNERASIYEYEGGLTPEDAEKLAYKDALYEYISDNYISIKREFEVDIYKAITTIG